MPRADKLTPTMMRRRLARREAAALQHVARDKWEENQSVHTLLEILPLPLDHLQELTELLEQLCRSKTILDRDVLRGQYFDAYHATPAEVRALLQPLITSMSAAAKVVGNLPAELRESIDFELQRNLPGINVPCAELAKSLAKAVQATYASHKPALGRLPANEMMRYNIAVPLIEWARQKASKAAAKDIDKFTFAALDLLRIDVVPEEAEEGKAFIALARAFARAN